MSYKLSSALLPDSRTEPVGAPPARTSGGTEDGSVDLAASLATIGDIVLAGQPAQYDHLNRRPTDTPPTVGRLMAAASAIAESLAGTAWWPSSDPGPQGAWRSSPAALTPKDMPHATVELAELGSSQFVALRPASTSPARSSRARSGVVFLARGRTHLVTASSPGDEMRAVRELVAPRTQVLGTGGSHKLINTGGEPARLVRIMG